MIRGVRQLMARSSQVSFLKSRFGFEKSRDLTVPQDQVHLVFHLRVELQDLRFERCIRWVLRILMLG